MGPHSRSRRGERLRCAYAAGPERSAEGAASGLLCAASSVPSGRLCELEVHCAHTKGHGTERPSSTVWGGEIRPEFVPKAGEIVTAEHWCSSSFANTDLDLQLKKHGIHQLIVIGLIAHTCIEATVRFAAELGYEVTVVRDATADYSDEVMHAALDINIPNYASAIVSAEEIVARMSAL